MRLQENMQPFYIASKHDTLEKNDNMCFPYCYLTDFSNFTDNQANIHLEKISPQTSSSILLS